MHFLNRIGDSISIGSVGAEMKVHFKIFSVGNGHEIYKKKYVRKHVRKLLRTRLAKNKRNVEKWTL